MTERTPYRLEQASQGRYEVRWSERKADGKWRSMRRQTGTTNLDAAEDFLSKWTAERRAGRSVGNRLTLADAYDAYLRDHAGPRGQSRTTMDKMKSPLAAFGETDIAAIEADDIKFFIGRRERGGFGKVPVGPSTIRTELVMMQAIVNWAMVEVMKQTTQVKYPKPSEGQPRELWMDEGQEAYVLAALPDARIDVRLFTLMGLSYGARKSAMLDLRFGNQVDWRSGVINFKAAGTPKIRKARPQVPMTPEIRADLLTVFEAKKGGQVLEGSNTVTEYGKMMDRLDLGWVTPHVLKHTFVTLRRRAGVPFETIGEICATDPQTLKRVYGHHGQDDLMAAINMRRI